MKVFLSHAAKDEALAEQLARQLTDAGLDVLTPYGDIVPGDNWAEKVARALEDSDLMLILLTPGAIQSDSLRNDIDYALSSKKFRGRLLSVIVGPSVALPGDVPQRPQGPFGPTGSPTLGLPGDVPPATPSTPVAPVRPTVALPGYVPWILRKQPYKQVASPANFPEIVDELMALAH